MKVTTYRCEHCGALASPEDDVCEACDAMEKKILKQLEGNENDNEIEQASKKEIKY